MIPTPKVTTSAQPYPYTEANITNKIPIDMAIAEISLIKLSISLEIGVSSADEARFAICPITVLSPVLKQIPLPEPAVHDVPKKPTFLVSKMF
jgi:hypothetical protein